MLLPLVLILKRLFKRFQDETVTMLKPYLGGAEAERFATTGKHIGNSQ